MVKLCLILSLPSIHLLTSLNTCHQGGGGRVGGHRRLIWSSQFTQPNSTCWSLARLTETQTIPVDVVVCRRHQQTAGALVSIAEGGRKTDRCFLQSAPPQHLPTAGTLHRHQETEDLLVTVRQTDHRTIHVHGFPQTLLEFFPFTKSFILLFVVFFSLSSFSCVTPGC